MKIIILGCGSSVGSPWITNNWGKCDKKNPKNIRTRCSALIKQNNLSVLIDTSPDIKKQILENKINNIDYVLYTHEHADQTNGIFELRPFFWKRNKKIDIYAEKKNKIKFSSFDVSHGKIKSRAYVFNKTAYLSDCDGIYTKDIKKLLNLKYLIIDCLKINPHPSHFNLNQAIETSNILKPKKTILTNLHTDLDYNFLKKKLPKNIIPAYDGLSLSI